MQLDSCYKASEGLRSDPNQDLSGPKACAFLIPLSWLLWEGVKDTRDTLRNFL